MLLRTFLTMAFSGGLLMAGESAHRLAEIDAAPADLPKKVAAAINPAGFRVVGDDGPVLDVWLCKNLAFQPDFSPTLNVKYGFAPGQLIGVLRVPEDGMITDFRGQEIKGGTYTLRYGRQPEDGNHIGTSETYDFLMAVEAKADADPAAIDNLDQLVQKSAEVVGSTHPAIFSLLPSDKPPKKAELTHDADKDFWILHVAAKGTKGQKQADVGVRLIVIGKSEG